MRIFENTYENLVFLQVGIIDVGRFKGVEEVKKLRQQIEDDLNSYVEPARWHGYYAEEFL